MSQKAEVQLKATSVLNVPLQVYEDDFSFIVNGEEFKTSRLVSDLISPKISEYHLNDPTLSEFIINTEHKGNFSYVLELCKFSNISIPDSDILFFSEVIEILGNDSICIKKLNEATKITEENIFDLINQHEKYQLFYSSQILNEIEFIATNFYELCETHEEEMKKLGYDTIERIISNSNLKLKDEDQLVKFINGFYQNSKENCSYFYDYVLFTNIESSTIDEFSSIFDINYLTSETWKKIVSRLKRCLKSDNDKEQNSERYNSKQFLPTNDSNFDGIIKYLRNQTNNSISQKVDVKAPSNQGGRPPTNVLLFEDTRKDFHTQNSEQDNWISFEFKENRVMPTHYQLMSFPYGEGNAHLKNWVLEGSNDNTHWENLDSQNDCSYLYGKNLTHLFTIKESKSKFFRFIRIRQTGKNWSNNYYMSLNSFELYGRLI